MADKNDTAAAAAASPPTDDAQVQPAAAAAAAAAPAADAKAADSAAPSEAAEAKDEKTDAGKAATAAAPAASGSAAAAPTIEQSLEEGIGNIAKGFGSIWGVMKARVSVRCAARRRCAAACRALRGAGPVATDSVRAPGCLGPPTAPYCRPRS